MKRDWFEQKLQRKLSSHIQSDIDLDTVWQDIEEIRYPRKKRRYFFYLIPLLAGLALLGVLLNIKLSPLPATNPPKEALENVVLHKEQEDINDKSNNLITDQRDQLKKTVQIHDERLTNTQSFAKSKNTENKINFIASDSVNKNVISESIISESITSESITSESITSETSKNKINSTYPTKINTPKQHKFDQNNKTRTLQNNSFVKLHSDQTIVFSENLSKSDIENAQNRYADIERSLIQMKTLESKVSSLSPISTEISLLRPILNFHQSANNHKPSLELGIAYGYGRSAGTIVANEVKIRQREGESHVDAQQVHVNIRKKIKRKLSIQTGLLVSQHVKLFQSEYSKVRAEEREDLILEIIGRNDGSTELVRGVGSATITERGEVKNYQRYRTVSIPMQIGYQITLNDILSLQIDAGINLGYSLENTGRSFYNAEANAYVDIKDLGYRNKFYMGHMYAIGFKTKVSESLNLDIGINSNWDLTDRNTELDVTDKFNRYGIYLGVTKNLAR